MSRGKHAAGSTLRLREQLAEAAEARAGPAEKLCAEAEGRAAAAEAAAQKPSDDKSKAGKGKPSPLDAVK